MSYYDIVFGPETCFFQNSVKCTTITSFDYIMVSTGSVDGGLTGSVPLEGNYDKETEVLAEEEESFLDGDGIPVELQGRQFQDIDSLHDELEVLGLSDYKFVLNDDGFITITRSGA
jgi:hypothetical protein